VTADLLVFDRVHARDASGPMGRPRGALVDLSLTLGPGVHAVLGAPEDGTIAFADALSGVRRPTRGTILVAGRDPAKLPFVRARIGVLPPEPRLVPASTVGASVRLAMRARGEAGQSIDAILDPLGLSTLHARKVRSLGYAEARAIELALALSTPAPYLLSLHEPFSDVAMVPTAPVRQRVRELGAAGVCVVVTTSSPADAELVADAIYVLHAGSLSRVAGPDGAGLVPVAPAELLVWVHAESHPDGASAASRLASALGAHPDVRGASWDETAAYVSASQNGGSTLLLRVRGDRPEACAAAVFESVLATGVVLEAMTPAVPALGQVRAASETLLRMRRGAARPFGAPMPPPPLPAPPPPEPPRSGPPPLPATFPPAADTGPDHLQASADARPQTPGAG
jgi:ABC-2 type transport system ATP-binding protein